MVEWLEGYDREVLAFFKTLDGDVPCSWLMHHGVGLRRSGPRRWDRSSLAWAVTDIGHLKELFEAVQHTLGLLQWSQMDLMKLLNPENCSSCSWEEYYFHNF